MKRMSLNQKLKGYAYILLIPATLLCIVLLIIISNYGSRYDKIVRNITAANQYNLALKEEIDYAMYRIVIGSADPYDLENNPDIKNPYAIIEETRDAFIKLQELAIDGTDQIPPTRVMQNLSTLEQRIDEIIQSVKEGGHYDDNIYKLETNIYILTELIQENIQRYIADQARNLETLRQYIEQEFRVTIIVSIVLFFVMWIVTWYISRRISDSVAEPLQQLCQTVDLVAEGDFSTRVNSDSGDELAKLTDSFNHMVEKIGMLVEDVRLEQLNLRAAELKLLQSQINPHFLYNTLDTIVWLAEDGQNEMVVKMVSSLSDFFRSSLSKGRDTVSLAEEKQHITSYLTIQQFRYSDLLEYSIDIPEELYPYQLLKLTLQPIVENALYHGIKNRRVKGMIRVTAEQRDGALVLKVIDNGIGMDEVQLENVRGLVAGTLQPQSKFGFGISNVAERIRLNCGEGYGLRIDSVYGIGTTVWIRLPLMKK